MRYFFLLVAISTYIIVLAIHENADIIDDEDGDTIHQRSTASISDKDFRTHWTAINDGQNLFPNRTKSSSSLQSYVTKNRLLSFRNDPYPSQKVVCEKCSNLTYCRVLNNLLIQEVYYPKLSNYVTTSTSKTGTCEIIEQRGIRLGLEIFGPDKTFRDTSTCRGDTEAAQ